MKGPLNNKRIAFALLAAMMAGLLVSCSAHRAVSDPRTGSVDRSILLAILPLENLSDSREAREKVDTVLRQALSERGFSFVGKDALEEFLFSRRVRYTDSLTAGDAKDLKEKLGSRYIMTGAIFSFSDKIIPEVGLSLRLVDASTGAMVWGASSCMTGEDRPGFLNIRRVEAQEEMVRRVVSDLLSSIMVSREDGLLWTKNRGKAGNHRIVAPDAHFFRKRGMDFRGYSSLAILPFSDLSGKREAGKIVHDYFFTHLHAYSHIRVAAPSEVRRALIKGKIRNAYYPTREILSLLQKELGVQGVIWGTVYTFREGINGSSDGKPEVELSASLIETATGDIVWSARQRREGDDAIVAYELGRVRSVGSLAGDTVANMLATLIKY